MKKLIALAAAVLFTAAASGCSTNKYEKTEKTAQELLDVVLASVEFPQTVNVTDEERIHDMGIDISGAEDYSIAQQMLSVDVVEVIILKVPEDGLLEAEEELEKRKDSLLNDFAFYPEQVESAEATVVGSKKDVVYLICHSEADTAEDKLRDAI